MFANFSVQMFFLIVVGAVIVVLGVTDLKNKIRMNKKDFFIEGKVLSAEHRKKEYSDGFLMQNYYDLTVEVKENKDKKKINIKSTEEYFKGERLKIYKDNVYKNRYCIYKQDDKTVLTSLMLSFIGVFVVFVPFSNLKWQSLLLALIVLLVSLMLLIIFFREKRKNYNEIDAEIVDVLKFENNNDNTGRKKIFSSKTVTYYPILSYCLDGRERHLRSDFNSSQDKFFKKGKKMKVYVNMDTGNVTEKRNKISFLIIGSLLLIVAIYGLITSIINF